MHTAEPRCSSAARKRLRDWKVRLALCLASENIGAEPDLGRSKSRMPAEPAATLSPALSHGSGGANTSKALLTAPSRAGYKCPYLDILAPRQCQQ